MCHGHSHGRYNVDGKIFDVGLDSKINKNFAPINVEDIIDLADKIEIKTN